MANFLFTPSNFHENGTGDTPGAWDGSKYHVQLNNEALYYLSVVAPVDGDTLSFDAVNRIAGLLIVVEVNSVVELEADFGSLPLGEVQNFALTAPLASSDIVKITFTTADVDDAIDVTLWPTGEGVDDPPPPDEPDGPAPDEDTYSLKGFVACPTMADNDPGDIAALGELSTRSRTFSKDQSVFGTTFGTVSHTGIELTVFSSKNAAATEIPVEDEMADFVVAFGKWMYEQSISGLFTNDPEDVRQAMLTEYTTGIFNVTVGPMVTLGASKLPQFVIFNIVPDNLGLTGLDTGYEQPRIKLWFSDAAFQAQYDEYTIDIIAPIDNDSLDDFFTLAAVVQSMVNQRTIPQLMFKVQEVAGDSPYTVVKTIDFEWHDPLNDLHRIKTSWTFVVYGAGGENDDAIKEVLVDWILDNSTHNRDDWTQIFPDIFTSTEFILIPMWTQYAVPNQTLEEGVYSPTVNALRAQAVAHAMCTGNHYDSAHITSHLSIFGTTFKSIAMLAVGGPDNRNGKNRMEEQFIDYMAVPTTSIDFNRMSTVTQDWIMLLNAMLLAAEDLTEFSDVPVGMVRLHRTNPNGDTILYLSATYRSVQYLVVSKVSMEELFPPVSVVPLTLTANGVDGIFTMPSGVSDEAYQTMFLAKGGYPPYTYSLVAPTDVNIDVQTIDPVTGEFNAAFITDAAMIVHVRVTDIAGQIVTEDFTLNVLEP